MSQSYHVQDFKVGNFTDQNGNKWCTVVFTENPGEPLTWVVKDPSKVRIGEEFYGHISDKTSKANKPYKRFYRDQKPEDLRYTSDGNQTQQKSSWQPRDDESIRIQWALGRTYEKHGATKQAVEDARWLIAVHDKLKQSASQNEQPTPTQSDPSQETKQAEPAGDKPWGKWKKPEPQVTNEYDESDQSYDPMNDPNFDPNEIPY